MRLDYHEATDCQVEYDDGTYCGRPWAYHVAAWRLEAPGTPERALLTSWRYSSETVALCRSHARQVYEQGRTWATLTEPRSYRVKVSA